MLLPIQRNTTYGATSPVKSADLDDIQDCIIGAKHPEFEFPHSGAGWTPYGYTNYSYNGAIWTVPAGGGTLVAAIVAPVGSRITSCKFGFNRANAGTVTYSLVRKPLNGGVAVVIATANDVATNGFAVKTLAAINHTMLADNGYYLYVTFDAAAAAAGSAHIGGSHFRDRL